MLPNDSMDIQTALFQHYSPKANQGGHYIRRDSICHMQRVYPHQHICSTRSVKSGVNGWEGYHNKLTWEPDARGPVVAGAVGLLGGSTGGLTLAMWGCWVEGLAGISAAGTLPPVLLRPVCLVRAMVKTMKWRRWRWALNFATRVWRGKYKYNQIVDLYFPVPKQQALPQRSFPSTCFATLGIYAISAPSPLQGVGS